MLVAGHDLNRDRPLVRIHADHDTVITIHLALPPPRLIAISGVRRAPLLPAEHSLLEPLPPRRCPGQRTPNESHTPHVDSRKQSDHPAHLNRTLAKARSTVNETSSRESCALMPKPRTRRSSERARAACCQAARTAGHESEGAVRSSTGPSASRGIPPRSRHRRSASRPPTQRPLARDQETRLFSSTRRMCPPRLGPAAKTTSRFRPHRSFPSAHPRSRLPRASRIAPHRLAREQDLEALFPQR